VRETCYNRLEFFSTLTIILGDEQMNEALIKKVFNGSPQVARLHLPPNLGGPVTGSVAAVCVLIDE
jgi:hypothetical protein